MATQAKHTPEPWTIEDGVQTGDAAMRGGRECNEIWAEEKLIATVHYCGGDFDDDTEPGANTRLISASPDLLAALKRMYDENGAPSADAINQSLRAIDKATA